eukprot:TRINITY_DN1235_c0_g1_i1.p1 TRINITY_DN1235_c0_g1~~TRINITY_DN1235_c0_g1_i1.p1  ORF type:complete len:149 (+),score=31.89 TRINITY_DN1235_c0_g1_i1:453-899(+)
MHVDQRGCTALHIAIEMHHERSGVGLVKKLLDSNATAAINLKTTEGYTPLALAVSNSERDVKTAQELVKELIRSGARESLVEKTALDETLVYLAVKTYKGKAGPIPNLLFRHASKETIWITPQEMKHDGDECIIVEKYGESKWRRKLS